VCAFWGIASGIVGAVVVLMGVIALRPMLRAGYDIKLASGVIHGGRDARHPHPSLGDADRLCGGGRTIDRQAVRAAMLPGFLPHLPLSRYVLGWALINPKIAPKLPPDQYKVECRTTSGSSSAARRGGSFPGSSPPSSGPARSRRTAWSGKNVLALLVPVILAVGTFRGRRGGTWSSTTRRRRLPEACRRSQPQRRTQRQRPTTSSHKSWAPRNRRRKRRPQPGAGRRARGDDLAGGTHPTTGAGHVPEHFNQWFWGLAALSALLLAFYYWRMDGEQLEILKQLTASVMPLGVLTFVVLSVILFGITTPRSPRHRRARRAVPRGDGEVPAPGCCGGRWSAPSSAGARHDSRGWDRTDLFDHFITFLVSAFIGATFVGTVVPGIWNLPLRRAPREPQAGHLPSPRRPRRWSAGCSSARRSFPPCFALHGGQSLIERWVLGMNLSPLGFLIIAQLIIFLLGWR